MRSIPNPSRRLRGAFALSIGCMLAAVSLGGAEAPADARPNLVVIMTDDQTIESMRAMDTTRELLGEAGVTFERSYSSFPLCCPSRATLLTGQYAHNHGVMDNEPPAGGFERFAALHARSNLATWLDDAGYRTALVGKYFNGYAEDGRGFVPEGWDEWYGAVAPAQHVYDYALNENGEVVHYGDDASDFKQDVLTERAVDVIEGAGDDESPFFLDLAYTAPHAAGPHPNPQPPGNCPVSPKPAPRHAHAFDRARLPRPASFNERRAADKPFGIRERPRIGRGGIQRMTRRYRCTLESLQSVDEGVGAVVDALRRTGELDDTVIVFTSDNGFFYGEHRIEGGKLRHYEGATRVPLLIRGPGIEAGADVDDPVVNVDLAATLLDAAGVEPPETLDGMSLLEYAAEPQLDASRSILLESRHYAGIRTDRHVYVEHGRSNRLGSIELYDLERDPDELRNLAGKARSAELQASLAASLNRLRDCAGPACATDVTAGSR